MVLTPSPKQQPTVRLNPIASPRVDKSYSQLSPQEQDGLSRARELALAGAAASAEKSRSTDSPTVFGSNRKSFHNATTATAVADDEAIISTQEHKLTEQACTPNTFVFKRVKRVEGATKFMDEEELKKVGEPVELPKPKDGRHEYEISTDEEESESSEGELEVGDGAIQAVEQPTEDSLAVALPSKEPMPQPTFQERATISLGKLERAAETEQTNVTALSHDEPETQEWHDTSIVVVEENVSATLAAQHTTMTMAAEDTTITLAAEGITLAGAAEDTTLTMAAEDTTFTMAGDETTLAEVPDEATLRTSPPFEGKLSNDPSICANGIHISHSASNGESQHEDKQAVADPERKAEPLVQDSSAHPTAAAPEMIEIPDDHTLSVSSNSESESEYSSDSESVSPVHDSEGEEVDVEKLSAIKNGNGQSDPKNSEAEQRRVIQDGAEPSDSDEEAMEITKVVEPLGTAAKERPGVAVNDTEASDSDTEAPRVNENVQPPDIAGKTMRTSVDVEMEDPDMTLSYDPDATHAADDAESSPTPHVQDAQAIDRTETPEAVQTNSLDGAEHTQFSKPAAHALSGRINLSEKATEVATTTEIEAYAETMKDDAEHQAASEDHLKQKLSDLPTSSPKEKLTERERPLVQQSPWLAKAQSPPSPAQLHLPIMKRQISMSQCAQASRLLLPDSPKAQQSVVEDADPVEHISQELPTLDLPTFDMNGPTSSPSRPSSSSARTITPSPKKLSQRESPLGPFASTQEMLANPWASQRITSSPVRNDELIAPVAPMFMATNSPTPKPAQKAKKKVNFGGDLPPLTSDSAVLDTELVDLTSSSSTQIQLSRGTTLAQPAEDPIMSSPGVGGMAQAFLAADASTSSFSRDRATTPAAAATPDAIPPPPSSSPMRNPPKSQRQPSLHPFTAPVALMTASQALHNPWDSPERARSPRQSSQRDEPALPHFDVVETEAPFDVDDVMQEMSDFLDTFDVDAELVQARKRTDGQGRMGADGSARERVLGTDW
jgi:hypothetical protein